MSRVEEFFASLDRRRIFESAAYKLQSVLQSMPQASEEKHRYLLKFVGSVFHHIYTNPELYDERCSMNIKALGERFTEAASRVSGGDLGEMESLFSTSYRFLIELQLSSPNDLPNELLSLLDRVSDYEYEGHAYAQLRYAEHQMIINVLQQYIHHPDMIDLRALPEVMKKSERERRKHNDELESREQRVDELKKKLDTYKTAFNFVGLYDGFKRLRRMKVIEAWRGVFICLH